VTILGYGLRGDFRTLAMSEPQLNSLEYQCQSWLDLDIWEKVVTGASMGVIAAPGHSQHRGLSGLAERYLGKPLDKRDQVTGA